MQYVDDTVSVGVMMMNAEGFDEMAVFHGVIRHHKTRGLYLDIPNEAPMEMSEKWLAKLKPVTPELDERFHGADHCLVIASVSK